MLIKWSRGISDHGFLGHAKAEAVHSILELVCEDLYNEKLLQLSMDYPSVNWKMFRLMQEDVDSSLLWLFCNGVGCWKMTSVRWLSCCREDYTSVTVSVRFPLYISRWLENVPVVERALQIILSWFSMLLLLSQKKLQSSRTNHVKT